MLSVDNPAVLFLLLLLLPAWLFFAVRFRSFKKKMEAVCLTERDRAVPRAVRCAAAKVALRSAAFALCVLALSGVSFGVENVPVQKSGNAVSFVFDISYSMLAGDALGAEGMAMTRLDHARLFALSLLSGFSTEQVSVVLAKGDGFVALPLTEDYRSVETLISALSPALMTAKGSSLARGIRAALSSFPKQSARNAFVFVFTDGDETDGALRPALAESLALGIPVCVLGFGSDGGAEVVSGDGQKVSTFLRREALAAMCDECNANTFLGAKAHFFDAAQRSARSRLLSLLTDSASETVSVEPRRVKRHVLLLFVAVVALVCSEISVASLIRPAAASVLLVLLLPSCKEKTAVFSAASDFRREKFRESTAKFLAVTTDPAFRGDKGALGYGTFGLSANYLALGEHDKSLEKLDLLLDSELDDKLRSAVHYNRGIVFQRRGDYQMAVESFKKAVLADGGNTSAKINLELCARELSARRRGAGEQEMTGAALSDEDEEMRNEIFTLIKNQESNQWRRIPSGEDEGDAIDY